MMEKNIIAITSCPVGVAHTYMAAENLEKAAKDMGVAIKVETHGSIGIENRLTEQDIQEAEGLIIAADTEIDKSRFTALPIINVGVQKGIKQPEQLIQSILDGKGERTTQTTESTTSDTEEKSSRGQNVFYKSIMNGVSYMVPFVVTGGLLIALALTIGGNPTEAGLVVEDGTIWKSIENIGSAAMSFMVPVLAGYIAYSIADRPGLVPGMIGGYISVTPSFYGSEEATAGFLGGIIAGLLAGYIALGIKKIKVPKAMQSVMPIIFIPIISTVIVGLVFIYLIGAPVASLFESLTTWMASLQGANSIILAAIIGAMISFDMGGPFNKVAFLFGVGLIGEGQYAVMGMVSVAVCIPPIALGIASHLLKNKFDESDRQAGTAAATMGFFGITEGAIPFAAKDPLRVIPSIMVGTVIGTIPAALFNVGGRVAHGGPIVALLGGIDNVLMFFVSVIIGVVATIIILNFVKKPLSQTALSGVGTVDTDEESEQTTQPTNEETVEEVHSKDEQSYRLTDLVTKDLINVNLKSVEKADAIKELLNCEALVNTVSDQEEVFQAVLDRESEGTTGMGDHFAIPHAKSSAVKEPAVLFGKSSNGIEWESLDGQPVNGVFLILVPADQAGDTHLKILQLLARKLMDDDFKADLLNSQSKDEIYSVIENA